MTLGEKQRIFTGLVARLINFAYMAGYELSLGEAYRSEEQAELNAMGPMQRKRAAELLAEQFPALATKIRGNPVTFGARNSLHGKRLAIDLNLFRNGYYLTDTDSYRAMGEYWKSLHELARWGGDFMAPDGNHFSLEHEGVR